MQSRSRRASIYFRDLLIDLCPVGMNEALHWGFNCVPEYDVMVHKFLNISTSSSQIPNGISYTGKKNIYC
jgi:hypothetical protein